MIEPPPTALPQIIATCLKIRKLKNPKKFIAGRQIHFGVFQLVLGKSFASQRFPISITATEYPFSESLCAETLPPNPEPIMR